MTTYDLALARLPFVPAADDATGILPPLMRITAHLVHALVQAQTPDPAEALNELVFAKNHADKLATDGGVVRDATAAHLADFRALLAAAAEEYTSSTDQQIVLDCLHRVAALGAVLDWELAGLRSDPGRLL